MDELKAKATYINSLLSKYIVLHDAFIKSSGSFWSIFKKINFAGMSGDAYFLFEQLRDERNIIEKLKGEAKE
ncbi:MAG: hypothetical protein ACMG6E_08085, partial [Candidatus Roizmanbacteria bacterium]